MKNKEYNRRNDGNHKKSDGTKITTMIQNKMLKELPVEHIDKLCNNIVERRIEWKDDVKYLGNTSLIGQ